MARQHSSETSSRNTLLQYALIMGSVILFLGIGGLLLGDRSLFGFLNIDLAEDIIHLASGGLMAWVGYTRNTGLARTVVGGLGAVYLLVGILGFFVPNLFGLLPHGYSLFDNLLHLALGVLGLVVARR